MQQRTKLERAKELRAIVDAEMSKPLPRITEVKRALGLLGPLLVDLAEIADVDFINMRSSVIFSLDCHEAELRRLRAWAESRENPIPPKIGDV